VIGEVRHADGLAARPQPAAGTFRAIEDSVALVTGAARGEHAVAEIGGGARLLVLDVTDAASIAAAAHQVRCLRTGRGGTV